MINLTLKPKEGWVINPNDKIVNGVFRALLKNDGYCPCVQPEGTPHEDTKCPCVNYIKNDICCCKLYIKK